MKISRVFVFFVNRVNILEMGITANKFVPSDNKEIIPLSKEKKVSKSQPYFILIDDTITLNNPKEDGSEQENSKELQQLLKGFDEIYLVIHKSKQSNCLETFQRLFAKKLRDFIIQSHVTDSIYGKVLKPALMENNIKNLTELENQLLNEFPVYQNFQLFIRSCADYDNLKNVILPIDFKNCSEVFNKFRQLNREEHGANFKEFVMTFNKCAEMAFDFY